MKLLVLCERFDSEGGTESYLQSVLPALIARGDEVRVLARSNVGDAGGGLRAQSIAWSDEHDRPSTAAAARVTALAQAFAPDVAVAHNVLDAGVLDAARANARRFVYHLHDHRPFCPNGDRRYPQGGGVCGVAMGRATCGFHALVHGCAYGPRPSTFGLIAIRQAVANRIAAADAAVAFSHYVADLATRNGLERVRTIAPALAGNAFAAVPARRPPTDAVLFAGRVMPSKGARSLVSALASIPPAARPVLRIAGDGPDLAAACEQARAQGVRIETLGHLDARALRDAYDAATLVAVPSLWGEPFGLVGIEAFARGRPVAAYDAGGISEWLRDGAGTLAPRGDARALADAIQTLLDRDGWERAAAAALAQAQRYRLDPHVSLLRSIYRGDA